MGSSEQNHFITRESIVIASHTSELPKIEHFAQSISQRASLNEEQTDNMAIVLTELANNAILHGNRSDVSKKVTLVATYYKDRIQVSVKDEGNTFDPSNISNPTDPENLWKETGRGIFLVRNLIDDVQFNPTEVGMEIIVTEYFQQKNGNGD